MKLFAKILSVIFILWIWFFWTWVQAWFLKDLISSGNPSVPYCQWDDEDKCSIEWWVRETEKISSVVTDQKASQYIQNVIAYLLTFTAIIAVLYIIYAGFNLLTWNWDEEKVKKSKNIIIYVILGIITIFLAYAIITFIFDVLDTADNQNQWEITE